MNTYPEMNEKIVEILRQHGDPVVGYAAARIEELEQQLLIVVLTGLTEAVPSAIAEQEAAGLLERLAEWANEAVLDGGHCFGEDMGTSSYATEHPEHKGDANTAHELAALIRKRLSREEGPR